MNDEQKGELIHVLTQQILSGLMKQDFADWHAGRFEAFVTGDLENRFGTSSRIVAEALIMQDIQRLFNII
jgi:hypothetical protein